MPLHAFADESKVRDLLVVAVVAHAPAIERCRTAMRGPLLANQRRLHMSKERPSRQRQIRNVVAELPIRVWTYRCATRHEPTARASVLRALVDDLGAASARRLVLEQDDSLVQHDREVLYRAVRESPGAASLSYLHLRPHQEPMLWIPDAIAWCLAAGGPMSAPLRPLVEHIRVV